jgi:cobalt/nickel transport system permease protein
MLPSWFQKNGEQVYEHLPGATRKKIRFLFVDRTLKATAGLLQEFVFSEAYAQKPGWLQALDPRAKLLGILIFIVTTSLLHSLSLLLALYGLSLVLALLSRIEAGFFMKRVWVTVVLFVGIIALPAVLNIFTPGDSVLTLYSIGQKHSLGPYTVPAEITITRQGLLAALFLVVRVATSMSFVLLLTLTTPWADLLKALRLVRVPPIYVQTLSMTLRYLMLLCQTVGDMHIAKKSRTIRLGKTRTEQRWVAGQVGALFQRTVQLSTEVHRAMVARGYHGEVRILTAFRIQKMDCGWIFLCASLAAVAIYWGR